MNLTADFISQIEEKAHYLDDNKKRLILEIIDNFLPEEDDEDELTDRDLHFIALAEQEYANGETISHDKRAWK